MTERMITVPEVGKEMNFSLEKNVAWAVGAAVRDLYQNRYGELPKKRLRRKTNGGGSHCFAVYPEHMRQSIEQIIRMHEVEVSRQGSLFLEAAE
jgi:hypothetical protein